jgi:prevent-host-death family protein
LEKLHIPASRICAVIQLDGNLLIMALYGHIGDYMKKRRYTTEEIGIRRLKAGASELVRMVKEERARYVITNRGKPAALLIPLEAAPLEESRERTWERLASIGEELSSGRKREQSAVEILAEIRR